MAACGGTGALTPRHLGTPLSVTARPWRDRCRGRKPNAPQGACKRRFPLPSARTTKGNSRLIAVAFAGLAFSLATIPGTCAGVAVAGVSPAAAGARHITPAHATTVAVAFTAQAVAAGSGTARHCGRLRGEPSSFRCRHRGEHARHRHHLGPRRIARRLLARFGWGHRQFRFLNWLWLRESGWNRHAANPVSGAYGIPQAVPGSVMASAGPGWRWNARTQIRWGLRYIRARYGSPRQAWLHECSYGWY